MKTANRYPYLLGCQLYYIIERELQSQFLAQGLKTKTQVLTEIAELDISINLILGEMTGF